MSEIISSVLMNIEKEENELQTQTLLAKAVQWKYGDETGKWIKFDPTMNKVSCLLPTLDMHCCYMLATFFVQMKL